jgi:hypothetical protein
VLATGGELARPTSHLHVAACQASSAQRIAALHVACHSIFHIPYVSM